jgi:hypothetical protein
MNQTYKLLGRSPLVLLSSTSWQPVRMGPQRLLLVGGPDLVSDISLVTTVNIRCGSLRDILKN